MEEYTIELKDTSPFRKNHNKYNKAMSSIIDDIFQTESIGPDGYIFVGKQNIDELKRFTPATELLNALSTIAEPCIENYQFFPDSEHENTVTNLLLYGGFNTYVLAGGMGTGKSSISQLVISTLRNNFQSNNNHCFMEAKFDFNQEIEDGNDMVTIFKEKLLNKLKAQISRYLTNNLQTLIDFIANANTEQNSNDFADFFDFYSNALADNERWNKLNDNQKINELIGFISKSKFPLELLMAFLKYLKLYYSNNTFFILVIDNIDRLSPRNQFKILQCIFPLIYISKIKCLVPLRRATFKRNQKKLEKDNRTKSSFSYGYISHSGISPISKVRTRLKYTLDNINSIPILSTESYEFKEAFKNRLVNILDLLTDDNTTLSKFLIAICGRSTRLCLSLMQRLFINNAIDYQSNFIYVDLATKALMIKDNESFKFENSKDYEILNIFASSSFSDSFSLLPYYIIQILNKNHENVEKRQLGNLIRAITQINSKWKQNDILNSLNYLLSVKRPLIWSDDQSYYDINNFSVDDDEDIIQLTELGSGYYEYLLNHSTQYIQECLISTKWKYSYAPTTFEGKSRLFTLRFGAIRGCIKEILQDEKYIKIGTYYPLSKLVFQTTLSAFVGILNKDIEKYIKFPDVNSELQYWKSVATEIDTIFVTGDTTLNINHYNEVMSKFEKAWR